MPVEKTKFEYLSAKRGIAYNEKIADEKPIAAHLN